MNQLGEKNKINKNLQLSLYCLCWLLATVIITILIFILTVDEDWFNKIIIITLFGGIYIILGIPSFVKNIKELSKAIKVINNIPKYYFEIFENSLTINSLNGKYQINIRDITNLNYTYDRALIISNLLLLYGNHKYKLNTCVEKSQSLYAMFDLTNEFIQLLNKNKETSHGIILITTNDYFFVLPEISNVKNCFYKLKEICKYTPKQNLESIEFVKKIYSSIFENNKNQNIYGEEKKFISLVNMIEGVDQFDLQENIKYLEELNAINYLNLLQHTKNKINNISNKNISTEDISVEFFNNIKILNEQEPFYEKYLVPYVIQVGLDKYINKNNQ